MGGLNCVGFKKKLDIVEHKEYTTEGKENKDRESHT